MLVAIEMLVSIEMFGRDRNDDRDKDDRPSKKGPKRRKNKAYWLWPKDYFTKIYKSKPKRIYLIIRQFILF